MKEVQKFYPEEFKSRDKEMKHIKAEEAKMLKIKITYGNTCKKTYPGVKNLTAKQEKNEFTWEAYCDFGLSREVCESLIKEVVFKLHPTFKNPVRTVKKWPYTFRTSGWGTFDLPIIIKWKDHLNMEDLKLEHYVSFDIENNGKSNVYALKIIKPKSLKQEVPKPIKRSKEESKSKASRDTAVWR